MPFWMTLYAEGTRFTAAKHERAEEVAKEKNYKSLQYHLQPRPTGFVTMIKKLRENRVNFFFSLKKLKNRLKSLNPS